MGEEIGLVSNLFLCYIPISVFNIGKYNFKQTDIIYLARFNRKKSTEIKYNLYNHIFNGKKNIFYETAFLTKDLSIVKHLNFIYGDYLYYYFRNNIWLEEKKRMMN